MPRLSSSFVVNRPVEDVFSYIASFENRMNFEKGLIEAEQTSEGPFGLGSTGRHVRKDMGRRMESTAKITAFEPNKTFTFESMSGPMIYKGTWTFEPTESTTKVSMEFEGRMKGLMRLFEPLMVKMFKGEMEGNTVRLKDVIESQG